MCFIYFLCPVGVTNIMNTDGSSTYFAIIGVAGIIVARLSGGRVSQLCNVVGAFPTVLFRRYTDTSTNLYFIKSNCLFNIGSNIDLTSPSPRAILIFILIFCDKVPNSGCCQFPFFTFSSKSERKRVGRMTLWFFRI